MQLANSTILITGGASGIGLELTKQLSSLAHTIIITGRNLEKLEKAKQSFPNVHFFQSDISRPLEIVELHKKVISRFPQLNILINNAGIMKSLDLHDAHDDLTLLTQEIETNLSGPIRLTQQFLPHLKKQASAAIVNVSSGLAFAPLPLSPVYCATKAGLHSYTLSLRVQLKHTGVKVFELAPPATSTDLLDHFAAEDMQGIKIMPCADMVKIGIKGILADQFEICPGQASLLKFLSRLAPGTILSLMSQSFVRKIKKSVLKEES